MARSNRNDNQINDDFLDEKSFLIWVQSQIEARDPSIISEYWNILSNKFKSPIKKNTVLINLGLIDSLKTQYANDQAFVLLLTKLKQWSISKSNASSASQQKNTNIASNSYPTHVSPAFNPLPYQVIGNNNVPVGIYPFYMQQGLNQVVFFPNLYSAQPANQLIVNSNEDKTLLSEYNVLLLMKIFGIKIDIEGMCYGIGHVNMLKFLCEENEIILFYQTLMERYLQYLTKIQPRFLESYKNIANLSSELCQFYQRKLYDYNPDNFYQIQNYFRQIDDFQRNQPTHTKQSIVTYINSLTNSKLITKKGLKEVDCLIGNYRSFDLLLFLGSFEAVFASKNVDQIPISVMINSNNHSFHIGFKKSKEPSSNSHWGLMTMDGQIEMDYLTVNELIDHIRAIFSVTDNNDDIDFVSIFETKLYCTGDQLTKIIPLIQQWHEHGDFKASDKQTNEKNILKDKDGNTLLYLACRYGNVKKVIELLSLPNTDLNATTKEGGFPLYIAAQEGHLEVMQHLIKHDAKVNQLFEKFGTTALYIAALKGNVDCVAYLMANGANPNQSNTEGATPLYIAVQQGNIDIVTLLLGCNINALNKKTDCLKSDPNKSANNGMTPLIVASQQGNIEIVNLLIANGADINQTMQGGFSPLHFAVHANNFQLVKLLVENGANIKLQANNKSPLDLANDLKFDNMSQYLTSITNPNPKKRNFISSIIPTTQINQPLQEELAPDPKKKKF